MSDALTPDRAMLLLEGLWDQLESVIASMRSGDEQPNAIQRAEARIAAYRIRLREVIERTQLGGVSGRTLAERRSFTAAMCEVLELLDSLPDEPVTSWIAILYQSQDAVLAALHELRSTQHMKAAARSTSFVQV